MPRAGRDLEELVRDLEGFLADSPVVVKSPDFVIGKLSEARLEVDVSVTGRVGSMSILAIIECRKRKKRGDLDWIYQLASKKLDVGADRVVAVSAAGFTAPARKFASKSGIELRTFAEIDKSIALSWVGRLLTNLLAYNVDCKNFHFKLRAPAGSPESGPFQLGDAVHRVENPLLLGSDGKRYSLDDVLFAEIRRMLVEQPRREPGTWDAEVTKNLLEGEIRYTVETAHGVLEVIEISATVHVELRIESTDVEKFFEYSGDSGVLSRSAQAHANSYGLPIVYGFHETDGASKMAMTITRKDGDTDRGFEFYLRGASIEGQQKVAD